MRRRARALLLAVTVTARVLDTQRAVSLPVDSERQRVVTVDASPLAVKRALRRYDARSHKYCGAVVAKAHRRHERNQDGLGAQVLRADQLAPLLLAHVLTGLRIACRPHEWDFGDAYGEEGAMAIFGCGRGADGRTRGVGAFAWLLVAALAGANEVCIDKQTGALSSGHFVVDPAPHSPKGCLLYTSPSPRDKRQSRMPSSA